MLVLRLERDTGTLCVSWCGQEEGTAQSSLRAASHCLPVPSCAHAGVEMYSRRRRVMLSPDPRTFSCRAL